MPVKCADIFKIIDEIAPKVLAEGWDNSGLQVGDPGLEVDRLLLTLDVSLEVAAEAREKGAGLIVSHHPVLFKPPRTIRLDCPAGELIASLIKNNITVYSVHTNLDIVSGGVNTVLAEKIGLTDLSVLRETGRDRYIKLAVFVPADHAENVRKSVSEAGAGFIGHYSDCSFMTRGTGTFRPLEGTDPYIGKTGKLELVEEIKLETIVPAGRLSSVIGAMIKAHPYEEVAYDLYPLENETPAHGLGRIGILQGPMLFRQFAKHVKKALNLTCLRLGGPLEDTVRKVAVCGGSGADLWPLAVKAGADTYVTGDVKYHEARDMVAAGLKFLDAGHHGTESAVLPVLQSRLSKLFSEKDIDVEIILSKINADPFLCF